MEGLYYPAADLKVFFSLCCRVFGRVWEKRSSIWSNGTLYGSWCCCLVASVVSDSVRPHRQQPIRIPVPGILQARTLEWVAIAFSVVWKNSVKTSEVGGAESRWRRNRTGDHVLFYKFIERTTER